jgi:hypothetical protein
MKNILSSFARVKVLVLAFGVFCALPALAHGQSFKGKFTLATETHWGSAVLAPGAYDFSLDSTVAPNKVVIREASGNVKAILISMWSSETSPVKTNTLELETHAGAVFVSALYLNDIGTELHFTVPKVKEDVIAREAAKPRATTMTASAQ